MTAPIQVHAGSLEAAFVAAALATLPIRTDRIDGLDGRSEAFATPD